MHDKDHLTTDMHVARNSVLSKVLRFVKFWPENRSKSVKVCGLRDSCKTVKVSDTLETLPPPYVLEMRV